MAQRLTNLKSGRERVVAVGLFPRGEMDQATMDELCALCETAGGEMVAQLVQRREREDPTYYIGSGKVDELKRIVDETKADVVIFNGDLSLAQARNLENRLGVRVVDRTELILDIFATHAKTKQAKLQVELARLEYELPRLKRRWTHLERIKGGIGLRGPGEKQLEEDRRVVKKRITDLKRELDAIEKHRRRIVESRKQFQVCLVGYTNAGKTTLLNRLTGAHQTVSRKLFSTLDTRTRLWRLPDGKKVLLSDTVGFIRDIPHHLVASFHATLEEAINADLLLHMVDASDPAAEVMIQTVEDVLAELHAEHIMRILLLNKVDRISDHMELTLLLHRRKDAIPISARTGEGIDALVEAVSGVIEKNWRVVRVRLSASDGETISAVERLGRLIAKRCVNEKIYYTVSLPSTFIEHLRKKSDIFLKYMDEKEG